MIKLTSLREKKYRGINRNNDARTVKIIKVIKIALFVVTFEIGAFIFSYLGWYLKTSTQVGGRAYKGYFISLF